MNYGLYKRIMKHDQKAIDEIETLEQAKEIIKMMTGNVYLNGEIYNQFIKYNPNNEGVFQFESKEMIENLKRYTNNRNYNADIDID
jgi:adenine C2-methylase RlmN of 23S rRNA A2503 and tRNA A37